MAWMDGFGSRVSGFRGDEQKLHVTSCQRRVKNRDEMRLLSPTDDYC